MLIPYNFVICIPYGAVYQPPTAQSSFNQREYRDWKTSLHSPIHFSNLRKLKCSLNIEAECSHAFQSHQIEFTLPEGHVNATAKSYPMVVNK